MLRSFRSTRSSFIALFLLASALGACSGDVVGPDTRTPPVATDPQGNGNAVVQVSGLPEGVHAGITVRGPSGFVRRLGGTDTLRHVPAGLYTATPDTIVTSDGRWTPEQSSVPFAVVEGVAFAKVSTRYALSPRRSLMIVEVAGLPASAAAALTLSGPGGASESLTGSDTVETATTGTWTLAAASVATGGHTYVGAPASQSRNVRSRDVVRFPVSYQLSTGALAIAVSGLPSGATPSLTVTGPAGFSRAVSGTTTFTNLQPGTYTVAAASVTAGGITYSVSPASRAFTVDTGLVATAAQISYAAVTAPTGSLVLGVTGLPTGEAGSVLVTGPNGFSRMVTAGTTLTDLVAGAYVVTPARVRTALGWYDASPASLTLSVPSGGSVNGAVSYTARQVAVQVQLSGLPAGTAAASTLTTAAGTTTPVTTSSWYAGSAGRWQLAAAVVRSGGFSYAPSPASYDQPVLAGDTLRFPVSYALSTGAIAVSVSGLPAGTSGTVLVSGPGGYTRTLSATETLTDLTPGTYTVTASAVTVSGIEYRPTPATRTVTVTASLVAQAAGVTYASQAGQLAVTVAGLPAGAAGDVLVTGPNGFSQVVTGTETIAGIGAGTYTLTARVVRTTLGSYSGSLSAASVAVTAGATASSTATYAPLPSVVIVSATGVPAGSSAALTLTAPAGTTTALTGSSTISPATTGRWRLAAASVQSGGHTYTASPASYDDTVLAGDTLRFPVAYTLSTGAIAVSVTGLPAGAAANVTVTGPAGFSRSVTATQTLTNLVPGTYTVTAAAVSASGASYAASPTSRTVTVTASLVAQAAAVSYSAMPSVVLVTSSGLPSGTNAALSLTSPSNVVTSLTGSHTVSPAESGRWRLAASSVQSGGHTYTPSPASYDQTVLAGDTLRFPVTYALSTGAIAVTVSGLPGSTSGSVTVTGPNSYSRAVTATTTITNLAPGTYTVTAATVSASGISWVPTPLTRTVTVTASLVAQAAPVTYTGQFGRLTTSASGLPAGATPTFTLTGAASRSITGAVTTDSLPSGSYTVTPASVTVSGTTYTPSPASSTVTITTGGTSTAAFTYAASGGGSGVNYSIDGAYLTQAVQRMDGTVPLVAGREALLRVFVRASGANSSAPAVRVRLSVNGVEYKSVDIAAPAASVPTSITESTLTSSWNTLLAAADVRAGMQVSASFVAAPSGDSNSADNTWPQSGPRALDVRSVPGIAIRFVPIRNAADNTTGNVTSGNMATIADLARRQHPLNAATLTLRATFTSSVTGSFQSNDGNGAWNNTLFDLEGLRAMEGGGFTHYAGILATNYSSGLAGLAYLGGRSLLSWDKANSVGEVFSHELGHNFGRSHAPGCGAANADASYPLSNGLTDAFGWNGTALLNPASTYDHMGYCNPSWPSAYGWTRIMDRRQQFGGYVATADQVTAEPMVAGEESLVIWGGVNGTQVHLNPAVTLRTAPQLPTGNGGSHRLELLDATGQVLAAYGFTPQAIDHGNEAAGFAFAIPLRLLAGEVTEIRLRRGPLVLARQSSAGGAGAAVGSADATGAIPVSARPQLRRVSGRTRVEWDDRAFPLAVVRDSGTGTILGFLRHSGDLVDTGSGAVDVVLSNGVGSVRLKALR